MTNVSGLNLRPVIWCLIKGLVLFHGLPIGTCHQKLLTDVLFGFVNPVNSDLGTGLADALPAHGVFLVVFLALNFGLVHFGIGALWRNLDILQASGAGSSVLKICFATWCLLGSG